MTITLHGLKNCDTCKKALKALQSAGHDVRFVDIRAETDLSVKLPIWLEAVPSASLINTRSTTWRGLDDAARAQAETAPQDLLSAHPTLIKRPVLETSSEVFVGWTKDTKAAFGL